MWEWKLQINFNNFSHFKLQNIHETTRRKRLNLRCAETVLVDETLNAPSPPGFSCRVLWSLSIVNFTLAGQLESTLFHSIWEAPPVPRGSTQPTFTHTWWLMVKSPRDSWEPGVSLQTNYLKSGEMKVRFATSFYYIPQAKSTDKLLHLSVSTSQWWTIQGHNISLQIILIYMSLIYHVTMVYGKIHIEIIHHFTLRRDYILTI